MTLTARPDRRTIVLALALAGGLADSACSPPEPAAPAAALVPTEQDVSTAIRVESIVPADITVDRVTLSSGTLQDTVYLAMVTIQFTRRPATSETWWVRGGTKDFAPNMSEVHLGTNTIDVTVVLTRSDAGSWHLERFLDRP